MNLEFENLLIFCLFLYSRYVKSLVSLVIRKIGKVSIGGEKKKEKMTDDRNGWYVSVVTLKIHSKFIYSTVTRHVCFHLL